MGQARELALGVGASTASVSSSLRPSLRPRVKSCRAADQCRRGGSWIPGQKRDLVRVRESRWIPSPGGSRI